MVRVSTAHVLRGIGHAAPKQEMGEVCNCQLPDAVRLLGGHFRLPRGNGLGQKLQNV